MARVKLVNGAAIAFTPAEDAARDAEEAAYAAAPIVAPAKSEAEILRAALVRKGIVTAAELDAEKTR